MSQAASSRRQAGGLAVSLEPLAGGSHSPQKWRPGLSPKPRQEASKTGEQPDNLEEFHLEELITFSLRGEPQEHQSLESDHSPKSRVS